MYKLILAIAFPLINVFPVQANEIPGIVAAHTQARAEVNLPPLIWSPSLSTYAQQWANQLAAKNCQMGHRPNSGKFKQMYGENLYWAGALVWSDGRREAQKITAADAVKPWVDEKAFYNYQTNTCASGQVCGHYTQVVWRQSTEVGCAMAMCSSKDQVWVCNYNPPGNYVGQRPY